MIGKPVDLLWPDLKTKESWYKTHNNTDLPHDFIKDLNIELIANDIYSANYNHTVDILSEMCDIPEVINYRLDILEDFLNIPEIEEVITESTDSIYSYRSLKETKIKNIGSFIDIVNKIDGIENYIECIKKYQDFIEHHGYLVRSEGLKRFFQTIREIYSDPDFEDLINETKLLREKFVTGVSSISIGINFDRYMRPTEAVLLSVNNDSYKGKSLLSKIFKQDSHGISTMYIFTPDSKHDGIEAALYNDLKDLVKEVMQNLSTCIKLFNNVHTEFIIDMQSQFNFYMGAARFIKTLKSHGLKMCRPVIEEKQKRIFKVKDATDVSLALKMLKNEWQMDLAESVVPNDIDMDDNGRIFILTGPNQGGKTTFTRSAGIIQVLAQTGLYVPGSSARISPVDWIYTHFPKEEVTGFQTSRLAEECKQFTETFRHATRYSLILLNESLSSTTPMESLYLAEEIVKSMRYLGCRAIYATHLLDLAHDVDKINDEVEGDSKLISMVAGISDGTDTSSGLSGSKYKRTYKVVAAPPLSNSYAKEVAEKYGVSFEKITETLNSR